MKENRIDTQENFFPTGTTKKTAKRLLCVFSFSFTKSGNDVMVGSWTSSTYVSIFLRASGHGITRFRFFTCGQVHPREKTPHPGSLSLSLAVVCDELPQEDAECVGDAVDDHVAHKTGEDDDPSVPAVGGRRNVVVFAVRKLLVGGAAAIRIVCEPVILTSGIFALSLQQESTWQLKNTE